MVPKRLSLCSKVADPLASFGVVCGMVFPVLMFPMAVLFGLAELLIPELARCSAAGSQQRIQYLAKRSLRIALLYGFLFGGMLFAVGNDLCIKLYGSVEAGKYLRLFAIMAPMLYADAITDAMIKGLGQQTASVRYNILTSGLDVLFLYFLLPPYGMIGYYFSFLITHVLNFVLSLRRLFRLTGKLVDCTTVLYVAVSAAISVFLSELLINPVLRCSAYVLLFGCLLSLFRVISKEDIFWIKGLINKRGSQM